MSWIPRSLFLARQCRHSLPSPVFALVLVGVLMVCALPRSAAAVEFKYHNHAQMGRELKNLTKLYPAITKLNSIGRSYHNRHLYVLVIGKYAKKSQPLVPNVKYIANMHGNEAVGRELLLHLAEYLLTGYGTNQTIQKFLDTTTVHLMPTMNPDGYSNAQVRDCTSIKGRGNAYNYDLNRNFPDPHKRHQDPIQRETQLVMDWTDQVYFVVSANLHGGAEVVNYPWDSLNGDMSRIQYSATPDDDVFRHLALTYARSHPTMHQGASCSDRFEDGITNGADWYPVLGGMADYMYRRGQGYELLIEMSCCKYPDPYTLPDFWDKNREAMVNLLNAVHMGVKGVVYNDNDGRDSKLPLIGANVSVVGREEIVTTTSRMGEFYKLLLPGEYTLEVTKEGFEPRTIPFTVYGHNNVTVLFVGLKVSSSSNYSTTQTTVQVTKEDTTNRTKAPTPKKTTESTTPQNDASTTSDPIHVTPTQHLPELKPVVPAVDKPISPVVRPQGGNYTKGDGILELHNTGGHQRHPVTNNGTEEEKLVLTSGRNDGEDLREPVKPFDGHFTPSSASSPSTPPNDNDGDDSNNKPFVDKPVVDIFDAGGLILSHAGQSETTNKSDHNGNAPSFGPSDLSNKNDNDNNRDDDENDDDDGIDDDDSASSMSPKTTTSAPSPIATKSANDNNNNNNNKIDDDDDGDDSDEPLVGSSVFRPLREDIDWRPTIFSPTKTSTASYDDDDKNNNNDNNNVDDNSIHGDTTRGVVGIIDINKPVRLPELFKETTALTVNKNPTEFPIASTTTPFRDDFYRVDNSVVEDDDDDDITITTGSPANNETTKSSDSADADSINSQLGGGATSITTAISTTPDGTNSKDLIFQAVARIVYTFLIILSSSVLST